MPDPSASDSDPLLAEKFPPDEELIAYLDGELDEIAHLRIEQRLNIDPTCRKRLEGLKKTFDLLDHLPRPEPSATFASRTMTHIRTSGSGTVLTPPAISGSATRLSTPTVPQPTPSRSRSPWTVAFWCSIAVSAAILGYFGHLIAKPHLDARDAARRTSEQVRLLERLPIYLGVDDLAFARQLASPELFADADVETDVPAAAVENINSADLGKLETLFKNYPTARQQQLRRLDEEFSALTPAEQVRLTGVLERYAVWLDRLPETYRQEILQAPAAIERLDKVILVKARQWRESLPSALRERIQNAEEPRREQLIAELKKQESDRKRVWELARREWANVRTDRRPWPFDNDELHRRVDEYGEKILKARLLIPEAKDLETAKKEAETNPNYFTWYLYGHTLHRLTELHPGLPEPAMGKVIRFSSDLPSDIVKQLNKAGGPVRRGLNLLPSHGKWPEFAEAVVKEAADLKLPIRFSLGPTKPEDYPATIRQFWDEQLANKLDTKERDDLQKLEAAPWPEHSRRFMELARKHDLAVPGISLPGSPSRWETTYRRINPKK